jgi:radical SAM protein with 4Fe4S-binding SPASM domain
MTDPDFQAILAHKPELDFTWSFTSANGRITRDILPESMKLRVVNARPEPCVNTYNGPMVLPDGTVMGCSCVAAMDAVKDLGIGNIMKSSLREIWSGTAIQDLRSSFARRKLNSTCSGCDMYRDLEFYRTGDGRRRAQLNLARAEGKAARRQDASARPFSGG